MYVMPLPFLLGTLAGLASLALLIAGIGIVWFWFQGRLVETGWLAAGIGMLLWSAFGRYLVLALYPRGTDEPRQIRTAAGKKIQAPDGSILHVEFDGPANQPVIVLTHGWALDSAAWYYIRKELSQRYRLVLWDLPGLGRSRQPADGGYTIARLTEDLRRVIDETGAQQVTLVGHSIGGMAILTLCRLHPDLLARKVNGIVLMDTAHPGTFTAGRLIRALRWPLIEPLLVLTILFWPLIWLLNAQSYANGFSHIVNRLTSLSRGVTRGQLDFAAKYNLKDKPSVLAKGLRAILRWEERKTPARIPIPACVISGDTDRLTKPETGRQLSELIPVSRFVTVAPAGHNSLLEGGHQYAEAISQLVEKAMAPANPKQQSAEE
jgi:pimeloyl-ACP methyl ester carboxylesterase